MSILFYLPLPTTGFLMCMHIWMHMKNVIASSLIWKYDYVVWWIKLWVTLLYFFTTYISISKDDYFTGRLAWREQKCWIGPRTLRSSSYWRCFQHFQSAGSIVKAPAVLWKANIFIYVFICRFKKKKEAVPTI